MLGLSLLLLLLFGWSFNELLKSGEHGMRRMFILLVMPMVLVYFALISIMLWSTLLQLEQKCYLSSVLGAIGGLLFYVSDVLIAAGAIWQLQVLLHGRILVMCTYYGAQLLISLSVVTQQWLWCNIPNTCHSYTFNCYRTTYQVIFKVKAVNEWGLINRLLKCFQQLISVRYS